MVSIKSYKSSGILILSNFYLVVCYRGVKQISINVKSEGNQLCKQE
jgi:hypothetical protein